MRSMMALSCSLATFVAGASLTAAAVVAIGFSWMELTVRLKEEAPHAFPRTASQHDPQECAALRQANIALIHSAPTGERLILVPQQNSSYAGLTRVSIHVRKALRRRWPGHLARRRFALLPGHDQEWEKCRKVKKFNARFGLSSSPRAARDWPCPEKSTSRSHRACRRWPRGFRPC